jgi:RNA polymerase sigma factor (TIGR02999 family)
MNEVTRLLDRIQRGDATASEQLLPLMYDEMRKLAARHMAGEKADNSLEPTALVHEAYLRLVGNRNFESRSHFFRAASRAMRQILIDNARRRKREKHGGNVVRKDFDLNQVAATGDDEQLLALDEALAEFAKEHPRRAQLVELRFFGGMTLGAAANSLGISLSSADRDWKYARAWLYAKMKHISFDGE